MSNLAPIGLVSSKAARPSGMPPPARLAHAPGMGTKSRESIYGAAIRASGSVPSRRAKKPTSSRAKRGITECWATKARRNRRQRSAMP
jgi:hypothetical protein